uniref:Uncharacterized protein n=1 Tax=Rhizophora mucronata TaxID=61149 RepID=A0A2P2P9J5_RHIMU
MNAISRSLRPWHTCVLSAGCVGLFSSN